MKFLNYDAKDTHLIVEGKFNSYMNYLISNKDLFPKNAYEFAIAEWHYNPQDHRCPHDSWVESLQIIEKEMPQEDNERGLEIEVCLLGAYHDGNIKIIYKGIKGYTFNLVPDSVFKVKAHGDWIIDEIRLSEQEWLVHEIEFWLKGKWYIECEDIYYEWLPFEN